MSRLPRRSRTRSAAPSAFGLGESPERGLETLLRGDQFAIAAGAARACGIEFVVAVGAVEALPLARQDDHGVEVRQAERDRSGEQQEEAEHGLPCPAAVSRREFLRGRQSTMWHGGHFEPRLAQRPFEASLEPAEIVAGPGVEERGRGQGVVETAAGRDEPLAFPAAVTVVGPVALVAAHDPVEGLGLERRQVQRQPGQRR